MGDFLQRLKQRKLVQWALAYLAAAWVLLQVLDLASGSYHWPDAVMHVAFGVLALGFVVALVLAWYHGERGAQRVTGVELLLIALVLAVGGGLLWHFTGTPSSAREHPTAVAVSSGNAATAPVATIPAKSIAVLPFQNLSDDKKNEYFVAGMQDLILTKLADVGGLKVIARTSTAKYASRPEDVKTIGQQLGVATLLEGSVQKAGNQVLVNVQLIDAGSGAHIWAQDYTRTLDNVFGVEGDVAEKVATALKAKLSPAETARLASDMSASWQANNLFLQADQQANQGTTNYDTASWKAAIPLYQQAIAQAPNFALAYARLSYAQSELAWFGGADMDVKQLVAGARSNAEQALKLAPNLPAAHLALGYCDYYGRGDYAAALQAFAVALALRPNDADALAAQGFVQRRQGRFDAAIASFQKAIALDPRNSSLAFELGSTWTQVGRYPDAERAFRRALALDPRNLNAKTYLSGAILYATGDIPRALAAAQGDDPFLKAQRLSLLTYQRKYKEALALQNSIPDTPANFPASGGGKALEQANLYLDMGDTAHAQPLYAQALPQIRAQLAQQQGINQAFIWQNLADAELGLGHITQGMDALAKAQAIADGSHDHTYGPRLTEIDADLYAEAKRPDLAVPLLAKALASPGIGYIYSPVMLWIDPAWDPIRHDPGFQALLKKYAKYKPAVIPAAPASGSTAAPAS
ncbi:MAG TPA: tetratricopeptide repeat protein [Rhodanobacteraceae bacterium]|nr:tetratricopeptide repeat protein [Rhodanobacteraceae bacterium]